MQAWDPDWTIIDYFASGDDSLKQNLIPVPWFVYLAQRRGQIPPLPAPSQVRQIEGYGSYAIVTPEPFDRDREDHREIASQVKAILNQAELLADFPE